MLRLRSLLILENVNRIGFSIIFLLSSFLGVLFLSVWLMLIFALPSFLPLQGTGSTLVPASIVIGSIVMLALPPIFIWFTNKIFTRIYTPQKFFLTTFLILIVSYFCSFPAFFQQKHHLENPFFYQLVVPYFTFISILLTYLWQELMVKKVKTFYPIRVFVLGLFIFLALSKVALRPIESMRISWGNTLFNRFLVNIFGLDSSSFIGICLIVFMLISLSIGTILLSKVAGKKSY